ncbi:hypothetical protein [Streptomyces tauricus]|uniref:hypothetical protein n=1 Tax=Streptomyces tauricus TaxID=68274 RepID=UPI0034180520
MTTVTRTRGPIDGSRAAGPRPPFGHRPREHARACHSLVVRAPGPLDEAALRQHLAVGATRHPGLVPLRVWITPVPMGHTDSRARDLVRGEALRSIGPGRHPIRAVVVSYADGVADLVLVAVRSAVPYPVLGPLAALLLEGPSAAEIPALRRPPPPGPLRPDGPSSGGSATPGRRGRPAACRSLCLPWPVPTDGCCSGRWR